ncbi:MAG: hypothetical protein JNM93_05975 [Bacteriovoracaceae bacterium]|nr:hypothetical protein [Bacteriovoracaceae bacterium]
MSTKLETLRTELFEVSRSILNQMLSRKELVIQIQALKQAHSLNVFDPQQEIKIFQKFKPLLNSCDQSELFLFSFLMESQSGKGYPQWSRGEHLKQPKDDLIYKINPILLKVVKNEYYMKLEFSEKFHYLSKMEIS